MERAPTSLPGAEGREITNKGVEPGRLATGRARILRKVRISQRSVAGSVLRAIGVYGVAVGVGVKLSMSPPKITMMDNTTAGITTM